MTEGDRFDSTMRIVAPNGVVGPAERLAHPVMTPGVAVGARGDVLTAWTDRRGRLWSRYRPSAGRFGSSKRVGSGVGAQTESLALALDAAGHAVIAWVPARGARKLHVGFGAPSGWGAVQVLGADGASAPVVAMADDGAAVIAWTETGSAGQDSTRLLAATRIAHGHFGAPRTVAGDERHADSPVVSINDHRDAAIAWIQTSPAPRSQSPDGVNFSVWAAFRGAGGSFGSPVLLSADHASGPALTVEPSGRTVLAWRNNDRHRVGARIRSSTGVLGPSQVLSRYLELNARPLVPAGGHGAIVWNEQRTRRTVAMAQAVDDRRFTPSRTIAHVTAQADEPAVAGAPNGLSVIADPPFATTDPITWLHVPLR